MSDDGLKVSVLASGSTGNVTYIETPERRVLVDAGLSGKKIEQLMQSVGRDLKDVDSLFVTHEHSDHIQSVGVLARKYNLDVYANQGTWDAISGKVGKIKNEQKYIFDENTVKSLGDLDVESFSVSHDAAAPQFYQFHHAGKSFAILTDTGYVSDRIAGTIKNADGYLFEANHDTEMLRMGAYPWPLKQRIMGDHGHLSNEDGANALIDVIGNNTKKIYLGHLSLHNNMKDLAHLTVSSLLENHDLAVGHDFVLLDTDHEKADPLTAI